MNATNVSGADSKTPDVLIAKCDPASDSRAFRRCLSQFATGVTVITAQVGEERIGVTANSFSSLSLDPPLVLWSIAKTSRSYGAFSRAKGFAIHVLAEDQIELSQRFSSSSQDKYEGLSFESGHANAPVVSGTAAVLECDVEALHEGGDHVIIVGRVQKFTHYDRDVLLFVRGRYAAAMDHPEVPAIAATSTTQEKAPTSQGQLYMLVFQAFHAMAEAFEHHRNQVGIPFAQSRVLIALDRNPGLTGQAISDLMYMSVAATEDAIASLKASGSIEAGVDGSFILTARGVELRKQLADQETAFDVAQSEGLAASDIAATRRVLQTIASRQP